MKKKKNIIKILLSVFVLLFLLPIITKSVAAQTYFTPQVSIPTSNDFTQGKPYQIKENTTSIAEYVKAIYDYMLAIVGVVAAVILMLGGVIWLTAGGSSEKVSQAKSWITSSLTGLVLALSSYLILQTINPQLVSFTPSPVQKIWPLTYGCCQWTNTAGKSIAVTTTDFACYNTLVNYKAGFPELETNYDGPMSKYLEINSGGAWDSVKRPNNSNSECETKHYCYIMNLKYEDQEGSFVPQEIVVMTSAEECRSSEVGGTLLSQEQFNDPKNNYKYLFNQTCAGREGKSCNNSYKTTCHCIQGMALLGLGEIGSPCGNDGGRCVSLDKYKNRDGQVEKDETGNEYHCNRNFWGVRRDTGWSSTRSCKGSNTVCCLPGSIHKTWAEENLGF